MNDFKVDWTAASFDQLRRKVRDFSLPALPALPQDDGWSYGCDPAYLRSFLEFWANEFSLDACVSELNRFPQIMARVDDLDIHAIQVIGEARGTNPLLLLHGWPGSVVEFRDVIEPLAFPSRFGGNSSDAFDLVIPSLPGFGFSAKPASPIGARTTAGIMNTLMQQLGYNRYLAQGGDWGSGIAAWLSIEHRAAIKGIHLNYVLVHPDAQPQTDEEREWKAKVERTQQTLGAYAQLQGSKPASLAYAMHDNPAAQAAWILERFHDWSDRRERSFEEIFPKERLLANILVYLMNDAFASSTNFYLGSRMEGVRQMPSGHTVDVPTAVTCYPDPRMPAPPQSWVRKGYDLRRWNVAPQGGHFAAMEAPAFFVEDLRGWLSDSRR